MGAWKTSGDGSPPTREDLEERLGAEGLDPHWWSNAPGDEYGWHSHGYHKVLFCRTGSIVFRTNDGDFELQPGDRLDVEPGTDHAATVGGDGVECVEGWAQARD